MPKTKDLYDTGFTGKEASGPIVFHVPREAKKPVYHRRARYSCSFRLWRLWMRLARLLRPKIPSTEAARATDMAEDELICLLPM